MKGAVVLADRRFVLSNCSIRFTAIRNTVFGPPWRSLGLCSGYPGVAQSDMYAAFDATADLDIITHDARCSSPRSLDGR